MRSQQVYQALAHVPNRFALCRITSAALQKLHKTSTRPEETISSVLTDIDRYRSRRAQLSHGGDAPDVNLVTDESAKPHEGLGANLSVNSDLVFAID